MAISSRFNAGQAFGRRAGVGIIALILTAVLGANSSARAQASQAGSPPGTTCTWGGTPATPAGSFTIHPGLRATPSTTADAFVAKGQLAGSPRCRGTMRFVGQITAGSTCAFATFEGRVEGLPGVARFFGQGSPLVPARLFDRQGRVVGIENAEILAPVNLAHASACLTPDGFEGGWPAMFSSVLDLYAR